MNKNRCLRIILSVVLLAGACQVAKCEKKDFCVETITTTEGLSNNTVRDILQDSLGNIWFCTPNGLNRYDGTDIQKFTSTGLKSQRLEDTRTRRISEDEQGCLWISSMSDVYSCYDLQKKSFVDLTCGGKYELKYSNIIHIGKDTWLYGGRTGGMLVQHNDSKLNVTPLGEKMELLASCFINFIKKGQKGVWIGTEKGLYQWNGKQISCLENKGNYIAYQEDDVRELFMTKDGRISILDTNGKIQTVSPPANTLYNIYGTAQWRNLWIVYSETGCAAFDIANATFCEVPQELWMEDTRRLIRDNKGGTWISDKNHNILYIANKKNVVKRFDLIPKGMLMQTHEFFSVFHGQNDIIWISTTGNGLYEYNIQTAKLNHYTSTPGTEHHIPSNHLKYVYQDRSGSIWLGTAQTGVIHLQFTKSPGAKYLNVSTDYDSFNNQIRFLKRLDNRELLLGNRNGELYKAELENDKFSLQLLNRFNSIVYAAEHDNNGNLWVGTKGGGVYVGQHNYMNSSSLETSLSSNNVTDIVRDSNGRIWIATFGGGLNYAISDGKGDVRFRRFFNNTEDCNIRMICQDHNGWMWLATSNGIIIFEPEHLLADQNRFVRLQESSDQLRTNEIRTIFCDHNGKMWISETGKGLAACIPTGNYSSLKLEHYTALDGIVMTMIQSIEEDRKGKLWISTENGILCFDPEQRNATRHFFSYEMIRNSFCENSSDHMDGKYMLFGSNNGMLMINSDDMISASAQSKVKVSGIKLNGVEYYESEIRIPYNYSSLELKFSNFDYSSPIPTPYIYMMENADTCWSQPVCNSCYELNHIAPGQYYLHVRAFTEEGGWSNELVLPIFVEKPLWQRWWFIAIYMVCLVILIYIIRYQYLRYKRLKKSYENMENKMDEVKKLFIEDIKATPSEGPNSDKLFLETIEAIVKEEMSNSDFTSEELASRMNMSHTSFYNTANRLLGMSPKEYIRNYRMKEAARLLVTSSNNVSQIAFMVGYNDVSYFSKNFKKHFDMTPLRYKTENTKN